MRPRAVSSFIWEDFANPAFDLGSYLRELVYCIFSQVSHQVARRVATAQYEAARVQPKATLADHLEEFENLWKWITEHWRAELSHSERDALVLLATEIECDLFRILRNFAYYAAKKNESDFPFAIQNCAERLGVCFQYVSKLRQRFINACIIVQTAPPTTNRSAARFRWCLRAD
jgi:hypothetical protein